MPEYMVLSWFRFNLVWYYNNYVSSVFIRFATANVGVGFVLAIYVVVPICYWLDVFKAKTFPLYSSSLFTSEGSKYNITSIIDSKFHLDLQAYEREGPLYLSTFFAISYGIGFAALSATIVHVALFHGRYNLKHCYIIESVSYKLFVYVCIRDMNGSYLLNWLY